MFFIFYVFHFGHRLSFSQNEYDKTQGGQWPHGPPTVTKHLREGVPEERGGDGTAGTRGTAWEVEVPGSQVQH